MGGDTLTVSLGTANVTLASGSMGGTAPTNATHTADDAVTLAEHASGQITDQFDISSSLTDVTLFRFQLQNTLASPVTIDQVAFQVSSASGMASGRPDQPPDQRRLLGSCPPGASSVIAGATGTLTFAGDFVLASGATQDYTLIADAANLWVGDTLTLSLGGSNVTLTAGSTGGAATDATHTTDAPSLEIQITDTDDDVYERNGTIYSAPYPVRNSIDTSEAANRKPGLRFQGRARSQPAPRSTAPPFRSTSTRPPSGRTISRPRCTARTWTTP